MDCAYSNQVSWMPMSYLVFSSLVGDSVAVSRGCVWTRDWMNEFGNFSGSSSVVSSFLSCAFFSWLHVHS